MVPRNEVADVAIVGGGIAGLYVAWRLTTTFPHLRVCLYEAGARLGGRVRSVVATEGGAIAELGAMSFSDRHRNVCGLVSRFGLTRAPIEFTDWRHMLRGSILSPESYAGDEAIPYNLAACEKGKAPRTLLIEALRALIPRLSDLWPFADAAPDATVMYLKELVIGDRPLWRWGFWNLLATVLSAEAIALISATFGSAAAFANANAFDAVFTMLWEAQPGQRHYGLAAGMSALPEALAAACEDRVEIRCNHQVTRATWAGHGFELSLSSPDGAIAVQAKSLVAALPKRALQLIAFDGVDAGERCFDAVSAVPATKLYLLFDRAWWRDSGDWTDLGRAEIGACFTDLPIRQCYYFPHASERDALILASFADDVAASFWSVLGATPAPEVGHSGPAPQLVEAACAQLRELHPTARMHQPSQAFFVDWSRDPYGGAWHAWRPHVRSWEVREQVRRPDPELPFFICGEAFAQPQGWIEGAINNAEMMLERHFGVPRPDWVAENYSFEL